MSLKGFPSQKKIKSIIPGLSDQQAIPESQFVTVHPRGSHRYSLDTQSHGFYSVSTGNVISAATTRLITKNSHGARVGDVIRFTSGALTGMEITVHWVFSVNVIVLSTDLDVAPAINDQFEILRPVSMLLTQSGAVPVTVSGGALEVTQLLVKANTDRLTSIGYTAIDFATAPHTGGSYATAFTVPALKTAYKARIVQNGGNDIKFSIDGGATVAGVIPAGEKGDIEIVIVAGGTFKIDSLGGGNITSGKLFINFFGV